jgi:ubiquinone/menaquinone biosynthesis C-methylase UbiE
MTTNYDPIAEQYKRSKQQPWRAYVEAFTLMRLIGDPTGKKVIDIACGEGSTPGCSASGVRRKSPALICRRK